MASVHPGPSLQASPSGTLPPPPAAMHAAKPAEPRPGPLKLSKDWVIPARPKPGRKPVDQDSVQSNRKSHNRASQRAFRERKNVYVSELEDKVRQLQQDEGEKCVFFQKCAQQARDESQVLRQENEKLKSTLESLSAKLAEKDSLIKSLQQQPPPSSSRSSRAHAHPHPPSDPASTPSLSSTIPTSPSSSSVTYQSTRSASSSGERKKRRFAYSDLPPLMASSHTFGDLNLMPSSSASSSRCGLCHLVGSDCICEDTKPMLDAPEAVSLKPRSRRPDFAPIWTFEKPTCTGDSSNCAACASDPLNQAFCDALSNHSHARAHNKPLNSLNADFQALVAGLPCCRNPALCGSTSCSTDLASPSTNTDPDVKTFDVEEVLDLPGGTSDAAPSDDDDDSDAESAPDSDLDPSALPVNEAWSKFRTHPNIAKCNLRMLADVCLGMEEREKERKSRRHTFITKEGLVRGMRYLESSARSE